jgi:hypothetical protein
LYVPRVTLFKFIALFALFYTFCLRIVFPPHINILPGNNLSIVDLQLDSITSGCHIRNAGTAVTEFDSPRLISLAASAGKKFANSCDNKAACPYKAGSIIQVQNCCSDGFCLAFLRIRRYMFLKFWGWSPPVNRPGWADDSYRE